VEELIGPHTVTTLTPATIEAFRDHGRVRRTLEEDVEDARRVLEGLEGAGIELSGVADTLLHDGVAVFCRALDGLLETMQRLNRQPSVGTPT
jgi:transaldolase/glucose-6-phosphate isomerase